MKYILDFDRTVFDTDALYQSLEEQSQKPGTVESLNFIDVPSLVFDDAKEFFASHNKEDIYIVSSCHGKTADWDMVYQKEKVARTNIAQYVKEILIVQSSKVEVITSLYNDGGVMAFVDDMACHLTEVKEMLPNVHTVCIDRNNTVAKNTDMQVITSLTELDTCIKI